MTRKPRSQRQSPKHNQHQPNKEDRGAPQEPSATILAVASAQTSNKNQKNGGEQMGGPDQRQWWLSLSTWESVAVVVGVVVLLYQSMELRRTNDIAADGMEQARRQAISDNRPVVFARPRANPYIFPKQKGPYLAWDVDAVNYGSRPAVGEANQQLVIHGSSDDLLRNIEMFFSSIPIRLMSTCGSGVNPPDVDKPNFFTATSVDLVSEEQLRTYLKMDMQVAVVGRIEYCGLNGDVYQTDFCYFKLASGATRQCSNHNQARDLQ